MQLRAHMKIHSSEKLFECNECNHATTTAISLKNHIKTHVGENRTNATNVTLHLSLLPL